MRPAPAHRARADPDYAAATAASPHTIWGGLKDARIKPLQPLPRPPLRRRRASFSMSISNFFNRPHYTSDLTDFIEQMREKDPKLYEKQRYGRDLLWDRYIDPELHAQFRAGKVPQKDYVYYHWDNADK